MDFHRDAVLQSFLAESDESLGLSEEALVALETHPDDPELLATVFRTVHTIKGNSLSLGFSELGEFAHVMEDLLARMRDKRLAVTSGIVTLLLRSADALRQMVPAAVAGAEQMLPEHRSVLEQLRKGAPIDVANAVALPPPVARGRAPGRRRDDLHSFVERAQTLRIETSRLDRMLNLTGEVAITRGRLSQRVTALADEELVEAYQEMDRLFAELQELVMKMRMVPVGPVFRQFIRTVRDVAVAHGKQARLTIEGEDVEVDMTVVEHLRDPLTHMVRNALDHGIEPPDVRLARGKDPVGEVALRARHEAGGIVIRVSDDGAGIDRERVVSRALRQGLIGEGERLNETEVDRLIFEPGFTTATNVTDLSGRGVGMDVVRRNIEALRGSVGLESRRGEGTTVTLRLPLTLAIIDGFGVAAGGETYLVPVDAVVECLQLPEDARDLGDGHGVFTLRGTPVPFVVLHKHFGLEASASRHQQVVVVRHGNGRAGLVVDELFGESQAVIKPLGPLFRGLPGIAGSTILGSGRVALILDIEGLLRRVLEIHAEELLGVGLTTAAGTMPVDGRSANQDRAPD
jgi:two-component system chemotaxis sensor kinase CheA